MFYWAAVLATFALGTAAGDLTAVTFGLGYFGSGLLFAAVIAIPALGHWRFGMNPILAFWFAYVVTRPLGASFADWLAVSPAGRPRPRHRPGQPRAGRVDRRPRRLPDRDPGGGARAGVDV